MEFGATLIQRTMPETPYTIIYEIFSNLCRVNWREQQRELVGNLSRGVWRVLIIKR